MSYVGEQGQWLRTLTMNFGRSSDANVNVIIKTSKCYRWMDWPNKEAGHRVVCRWLKKKNNLSPDFHKKKLKSLSDVFISESHCTKNHYYLNPLDSTWLPFPTNWDTPWGWPLFQLRSFFPPSQLTPSSCS